MTDQTLIERYIDHLRHVRSYAARTVKVHARIGRNWSAFLREQRNRTLTDALPDDLLAWIVHRESTGVKDSTIAKDLCVFRTLHAYLHTSSLASRNPAASLPEYVCSPPPEKQVLTVEECLQILDAFDVDNPLELRNYVIVALFWSTGLRNSELCALCWGDIDLDEACLIVRKGKGGKQRQVFLNDRVCGDLHRYRQRVCCPADTDSDPVFFAFSVNAPNAEEFKHLSVSHVANMIQLHARDTVGLEKPVNPLILRHTFATHMMEAGVDISDIKEIMGHDKETETTVYLHVTMTAAKRFLNDHLANPLKYS